MSNITQVERQLYILSLLSSNPKGFTIKEIINNLNRVGIDVSRKTVERDIDNITADFFVYEEQREGKTAYFVNKYNVQHISFDSLEHIALFFAREVMNNYTTLDVAVSARKIIDRIIDTLPKINRDFINTLSSCIKVSIPNTYSEKKINHEYLELIRMAIEDKKSLLVEYYSFHSDGVTKRRFDPYFLEVYDGCWHLSGYCHLRKAIRELRVSRIISIKILNESYEKPENFYEKYKKDRFEKLAGEEIIKLKIRFTGEGARYVKEYESSKADFIVDNGNDDIIFERLSTMTPDICF